MLTPCPDTLKWLPSASGKKKLHQIPERKFTKLFMLPPPTPCALAALGFFQFFQHVLFLPTSKPSHTSFLCQEHSGHLQPFSTFPFLDSSRLSFGSQPTPPPPSHPAVDLGSPAVYFSQGPQIGEQTAVFTVLSLTWLWVLWRQG